jgi:hypothetical protein
MPMILRMIGSSKTISEESYVSIHRKVEGRKDPKDHLDPKECKDGKDNKDARDAKIPIPTQDGRYNDF